MQATTTIPTLAPEDTGLPMTACLLTRDVSRDGPRVEVSRQHGQQLTLRDVVSVSISDNPRIIDGGQLLNPGLRLVRAWVLLNEDVLLRYWSHELSQTDMMAALRPLGKPRGPR
jgi:hypothetical protein